MTSGVVLAAGHSRRMGREKATLLLQGEPLWQRQVRLLEAAGAREIWLSVRRDQTWPPPGARLLFDEVDDSGPMAGIAAALAAAGGSGVMVLAIDLLQIPTTWFSALAAACGDDTGAVGRLDGHFEPLAAIYPAAALPFLKARLAAGDACLQTALAQLTSTGLMAAIPVTDAQRPWFANANTQGDLDERPLDGPS